MAVALEGDKVLTSGELSFSADSKTCQLNAKEADGKPLIYQDTLDAAEKTLPSDREGTSADRRAWEDQIRPARDRERSRSRVRLRATLGRAQRQG